jgi:hypothetical protein
MSKLKRFIVGAVITLAAVGAAAPAVMSTAPANANSGNQWCDDAGVCPNAWSGGPFVKSYGYPAVNNDFTWINNYNMCNGGYTTSTCPGHGVPAGWPIGALKYTGSGSWVGHCIGDAYNDQNNASSSLDQCPSGSDNGGWGVNFVSFGSNCGSAGGVFYDIHWNGLLKWSGDGNGATVYLNNTIGYCLRALPYS